MTLAVELAEHRYPGSPRRIRVFRNRRDLGRHGYWLCAALRRNRHDNPFSRVSVALSTESPQNRPNSGIRYAATLLATSPNIRKKSPRTRTPGPSRLAAKGSPTLRQGSDATITPANRRRRDDRPVTNPPTVNGPTRTRSNTISLAGRPRRTLSPECQQPSHESVSNPVKDPVRNPPTAGQTQRPRTRPCLPAGYNRRRRNIEMTTK